MSLSDLASLGSFVSGFAVLVSLVFLYFQLRQMNSQGKQAEKNQRAAASQAHENEIHGITRLIVEHDDIAEVYRTGLAGLEGLSANQLARFLVLMGSVLRYHQASWLEWREARLDDRLWYTVEQQCRDIFRQPGFQEFWKIRRHWYTPDFRAWVDGLPKPRLEWGLYDLPPKTGDTGSAQAHPS